MEKIIDLESRKFLEEKFRELQGEVQVAVYGNAKDEVASEYFEFTKGFFEELSEIDPRIKLEVKEANVGDKTKSGITIRTNPTFTIGEDKGYKIVFSGAPLGYEASQVIETLISVSGDRHDFDQETASKLENLEKEVNIKVFVTPTCPYCPASAYLSNRIAIASKGKVLSEIVEANENPQLSMEWGIESVPTQIINDNSESITIGVQDERSFVESVLNYGY